MPAARDKTPPRGKPGRKPLPPEERRDRSRAQDVSRKRAESRSRRTVTIPSCADRKRRERLEADDEKWLLYYFAPESGSEAPFTYPFVEQQRAMIAAMRSVFLYGGDDAEAASRGEGKTTIAERLLLKYVLTGVIDFGVLFAATGGMAANSLDSIKTELETNDRLAADYPEVCVPIAALENTPNRAHYQLVQGTRHDTGEAFGPVPSKFTWCGQQVVLPDVPGSPAARAIIATRGLDSAVRGLKIRGRRPRVAIIDDADTQETCDSDEQAGKLEDRIESGISMLGGQQQAIARVMLCTVKNRRCVAFKFTDPTQKPTWKGKRYRFLLQPPVRADLWQEYMDQRRIDLQNDDEFGRRAHNFYLANRDDMDRGAVVANPHRFNPKQLPDGSQLEVSALQRYYNEVVRIGPAAVASELDNDPPEESGPVALDLSPLRIQRQVSGYDRGVIPPGVVLLTVGIDIGKWQFHFVVVGWTADATASVIDYGQYRTTGAIYKSEQGLDLVVHRHVLALMEELSAREYYQVDGGERMPIALTLIDASYQTDAVYGACSEAGLGVMPLMGFGRSAGCVGSLFRPVTHSTPDVRPFDGGRIRKLGKIWLVESDADRWKSFITARMMTNPGEVGCLYLFGHPGEQGGRLSIDEKQHADFAAQVTNEQEVEDVVRGRVIRAWRLKSSKAPNHYFDALAYAATAAALKGIRLPIAATAKTVAPDRIPGQQPVTPAATSLAELARLARAA